MTLIKKNNKRDLYIFVCSIFFLFLGVVKSYAFDNVVLLSDNKGSVSVSLDIDQISKDQFPVGVVDANDLINPDEYLGAINQFFSFTDFADQFRFLNEKISEFENASSQNDARSHFEFLNTIYSIYENTSFFNFPFSRFILAANKHGFTPGDQSITKENLLYRSFAERDVDNLVIREDFYAEEKKDIRSVAAHTLRGGRDNMISNWIALTKDVSIAYTKYNEADEKGQLKSPIGVFDYDHLSRLRENGHVEFYDLTVPFDFLIADLRGATGEKFREYQLEWYFEIYRNKKCSLDFPRIQQVSTNIEKSLVILRHALGYTPSQAVLPQLLSIEEYVEITNRKRLNEMKKKAREMLGTLKEIQRDIGLNRPHQQQTLRSLIINLEELLDYRITWVEFNLLGKPPLWLKFHHHISQIKKRTSEITAEDFFQILFGEKKVNFKKMDSEHTDIYIASQRNWSKREENFYRELKRRGIARGDIMDWFNSLHFQRKYVTSKDQEIVVNGCIPYKTLRGSIDKVNSSTTTAYPTSMPRFTVDPIHRLRKKNSDYLVEIGNPIISPNTRNNSSLILYTKSDSILRLTPLNVITKPVATILDLMVQERMNLSENPSIDEMIRWELSIYKKAEEALDLSGERESYRVIIVKNAKELIPWWSDLSSLHDGLVQERILYLQDIIETSNFEIEQKRRQADLQAVQNKAYLELDGFFPVRIHQQGFNAISELTFDFENLDLKDEVLARVSLFISQNDKFLNEPDIKRLQRVGLFPCHATKLVSQGSYKNNGIFKNLGDFQENYARYAGFTNFDEFQQALRSVLLLHVFQATEMFINEHDRFPVPKELRRLSKEGQFPCGLTKLLQYDKYYSEAGLFNGISEYQKSYARYAGYENLKELNKAILNRLTMKAYQAIDSFIAREGEFPNIRKIQRLFTEGSFPCSRGKLIGYGTYHESGIFKGIKEFKEGYARYAGYKNSREFDEALLDRLYLRVYQATEAFIEEKNKFPSQNDVTRLHADGLFPCSYYKLAKLTTLSKQRSTPLFNNVVEFQEGYSRYAGYNNLSDFMKLLERRTIQNIFQAVDSFIEENDKFPDQNDINTLFRQGLIPFGVYKLRGYGELRGKGLFKGREDFQEQYATYAGYESFVILEESLTDTFILKIYEATDLYIQRHSKFPTRSEIIRLFKKRLFPCGYEKLVSTGRSKVKGLFTSRQDFEEKYARYTGHANFAELDNTLKGGNASPSSTCGSVFKED